MPETALDQQPEQQLLGDEIAIVPLDDFASTAEEHDPFEELSLLGDVRFLASLTATADNVRVIGYRGSKFQMLDWLWDSIPAGVESVLDAFSGGANVAYFLKQKGLAVTTNDKLAFPFHIARAIVENSSVTYGKLANIVDEIGEVDRVAEGRLKEFTSHAAMSFEQKFQPAFTATPTAKLVLATNLLPRFADKTDAVWRRLVLIPFRVQVEKAGIQKDENLAKHIASEEMSGVLLWALDGLRRLLKNRRFTVSRVDDGADLARVWPPARDRDHPDGDAH